MKKLLGFAFVIILCIPFVHQPHIGQAQDGSGDPVQDQLNGLGVNTNPSPRRDANNNELPSDYSPLGRTYAPATTAELVIIGLPLTDRTDDVVILQDMNQGGGILHTMPEANYPDATTRSKNIAQQAYDATGADVDGDGFDELVLVYMRGTEVILQITQDMTEGYSLSETVIAIQENALNVRIAPADVNADGKTEVVVGVSGNGFATVMVADEVDGRFGVSENAKFSFNATTPDHPILVEIAAGNLDHDLGDEFVVVINEYIPVDSGDPSGISQYVIYDDAAHNYQVLRTNIVQAILDGIQNAVTASVALGDIDGDGLAEVVLGGLTAYGRCISYGHLLITLDDAAHNFLDLGTTRQDIYLDDCPANAPWSLRYLHVNTLDLDGDFVDEIAVNWMIYDDFANTAPWTALPGIPQEEFLKQNDFGWFDETTTAISVGDYTGDGREDLVTYSQNRNDVGVWTLDQVEGFVRRKVVDVQFFNAQNPRSALLVPLNIDADSPILQYEPTSYQLVFSEPIVIAALAAAPCSPDFGQNLDGCRTSFGNSETTTTSEENSVTISASVSVGVSLEDRVISQSALEVKDTLSSYLTVTQGSAYSRRDTVTFTTGPIEDTVIFTSVPIDRYIYTITSHPDPQLIGETVNVDLPRKPVTLMVERSFYNQNVPPGSVLIDQNIFTHTTGDPRSYPTVGDKASILQRTTGGFESQLQNVGQGAGARSVEIEIGQEFSSGRTTGLSFEFSLEVTGGSVMAGYSVGATNENNLTITYGSSTIYSGAVSSLDADNFAANAYSYGLFSYVYTDAASGQQFEVLNYWVE